MSESEHLSEAIDRLVKGAGDTRDRVLLDEAHPADIAAVARHLPLTEQVALFRLLSQERAGEVINQLDDATLLELVQVLEEGEVSRILDEMPPEHAADVVEELPSEQAEKILGLMQEDKSEEVQERLDYPEHSAGRLMSPDFVAVNDHATVEQAIEHVRKSVSDERAFELYVVDDHAHLVGVVPLRRLLIAHPGTPVTAIRDDNVVTVTPQMDREDVARLVAKYDVVAVPVIDDQNRLVGTITVDDVVDIVGQEASEDIFRMAGSDAAGNTGLQSVTMVVRGLATGQVQLIRWWEPLRRQIQTSIILGGVCGLLVGVIGALWHSPAFGLIVGVSMFISVNLSGIAGTTIPMLSKRLGFDPALTAGPFETALQDVLGVTIFLSLATALLHWLT